MTSSNQLNFPFSDLVAGYIRSVSYPDLFDCKGMVELETSDGRTYTVKVTDACYAEVVETLENRLITDMTSLLRSTLIPSFSIQKATVEVRSQAYSAFRQREN